MEELALDAALLTPALRVPTFHDQARPAARRSRAKVHPTFFSRVYASSVPSSFQCRTFRPSISLCPFTPTELCSIRDASLVQYHQSSASVAVGCALMLCEKTRLTKHCSLLPRQFAYRPPEQTELRQEESSSHDRSIQSTPSRAAPAPIRSSHNGPAIRAMPKIRHAYRPSSVLQSSSRRFSSFESLFESI